MEQPPDDVASTARAPRLAVGGRVTSANATPMFASDPGLGAKGTIRQADAAGASYLVRWEDGSESWARADQLTPAGRSALAPPPPGNGPRRPAPVPATGRARLAGRVAPLLFLVILGQGLVRPLLHGRLGLDTVFLIAIVALPAALALYRWLRRSAEG